MTERTYRIGEAARLLNLEGYVLRFWETEFSQLQPRRTPKGQRVYSESDLVLLRRIRELLHEQGMTIEGARRVLAGEAQAPLDGRRIDPAAPVIPGASIAPAVPGTPAEPAPLLAPFPAPPPVQALLPLFPARPAANRDCLALLAQVERELLSLQRLLRQPG